MKPKIHSQKLIFFSLIFFAYYAEICLDNIEEYYRQLVAISK